MPIALAYFPSGAFVRAELATRPADLARGLMGRASVPDGTGMLLDFGRPARHQLWMAGTLVALDMVFLDPFFTVVDVVERAAPHDRTPRGGRAVARYVLEVPGGWATRYRVTVGQRAVVVRAPT